LAAACRRAKVPLLIAGDAKLAHALGADGLHLPEWSILRSQRWQHWRRPGWMVTAAAHFPAAIRRAALAGVDAVLVSPVFQTSSHPQARALGPMRLARWARAAPIPVYALGGIDQRSAQRLTGIPLAGWSGIGGLLRPLSELRPSDHRRGD
jgi:thiamine-phosphate pyrophosphorylase